MSATDQVELERTEAGAGSVPDQPQRAGSRPVGGTPPANTPTSDFTDLFTDAMGGLWAGITTAVCVGVVALGNLLLLAAAYGHGATPHAWVLLGWAAAISAGVGVVAGVADAFLASRMEKRKARHPRSARRALELGVAAAVGTGVLVALLFGTAWLASRDKALAWQPVVGLSLSVVAVAAFGGFYLASRRTRVGFAASFVLTFLVLLSYMLTLDGLAAAANGSQEGELSAAADGVRELLTDFRGAVALIVGFYFGTDAAVSVVKIIRTDSKNAQDVGRLDRDLAVQRPAQPTQT
jgi:MFS family permease